VGKICCNSRLKVRGLGIREEPGEWSCRRKENNRAERFNSKLTISTILKKSVKCDDVHVDVMLAFRKTWSRRVDLEAGYLLRSSCSLSWLAVGTKRGHAISTPRMEIYYVDTIRA